MDVKTLFNIILLALSLTTIFITLISYIVFKLRQASVVGINGEFHKLEGSYFRRYSPELEKINEQKKIEAKVKDQDPKKRKLKIVGIFIFVFFILFTVLIAEEHYSTRGLNSSTTKGIL